MLRKLSNWLFQNSERLILLLMLCSVIYSFLLIAMNVDRGFDITDESSYILYALSPHEITGSVTSYGYLTGILLDFSNQSIARMRMAGLLAIMAATLFFIFALIQFRQTVLAEELSRKDQLLATLTIFSGVLIYYKYWLITPSYNWLNLISILVFSGAVFESTTRATIAAQSKSSNIMFYMYASLIGIAGGVTFLAKPTSAVIDCCVLSCLVAYCSTN